MPLLFTTALGENTAIMDNLFLNCADIKKQAVTLGGNNGISGCIYYIEVAAGNMTLQESVIGRLLMRLTELPPEGIYQYLNANALGMTDISELSDMDQAAMGVMIGDVILFLDGYDKALKIKAQGYPMMSVSSSEREQVMRGSLEGFVDSVKTNTALLRKRIRSTNLKVQEFILGKESHTTVALIHVDGLASAPVLDAMRARLTSLNIASVSDSGILEQLSEENIRSPFPQYQTTERPDTAAFALMRGRVVLLSDNSPTALLLPTNFNDFFKTSDDYYQRYGVATLARIIRYLAAFFALALPAVYLAVMNYHPDILPANMLFSFASGRANVPFPSIVEVLMMEFAFELLREAGIRIPGPMGNTIGIVGGLIIGQAAVSAGIVSPVIVVVVACTALSSFAIPNEELASAFRILKYVLIILAYFQGFLGITLGLMGICLHLASLKSFGLPYLMPIAAGDTTARKNYKDLFLRYPLRSVPK